MSRGTISKEALRYKIEREELIKKRENRFLNKYKKFKIKKIDNVINKILLNYSKGHVDYMFKLKSDFTKEQKIDFCKSILNNKRIRGLENDIKFYIPKYYCDYGVRYSRRSICVNFSNDIVYNFWELHPSGIRPRPKNVNKKKEGN